MVTDLGHAQHTSKRTLTRSGPTPIVSCSRPLSPFLLLRSSSLKQLRLIATARSCCCTTTTTTTSTTSSSTRDHFSSKSRARAVEPPPQRKRWESRCARLRRLCSRSRTPRALTSSGKHPAATCVTFGFLPVKAFASRFDLEFFFLSQKLLHKKS